MLFQTKHHGFEHLKKKWTARHKAVSDKFLTKHGDSVRKLTLGGLGGLMLMGLPAAVGTTPFTTQAPISTGILKEEDKNALLAEALEEKVPDKVRVLTKEEEDQITKLLSDKIGFRVVAQMGGIRLNRSYGLIGGEQHLYRFPGDNLHKHVDNAVDWAMYGGAGIAPGLGAWGYFAPSEAQFSLQDKERERYYLAVQTFLIPGYAENFVKYRDFFKYRKMLVINPQTGQTVVAVVADAGPAEWTGKHLGGSPEVMHFLGLANGPRKGAVLYFFIDDPEDKIPLGPITVNTQDSGLLTLDSRN